MISNSVVLVILTWSCYLVHDVQAHGRLMDPPARNSMWRLGFNNPVNYNDNELFCGGRMVQWLRNNGKCGVCGDPYHGNTPHEAGGKYANGIVTRSYQEGDEIRVTVHLTANHLGWFEFRLCPVNNPKKKATQKCLDENVLTRPDGKGNKYFVPKGKYNAFFNYTLQLPPGLTCKQCVMQWKYRTGNTWDKDTDSGLFCLGCGPQEEFYNCADVEILPKGTNSKGTNSKWTKEKNIKQTTTKKTIGPPPTHKPGPSKSKFKPFTNKPKVNIRQNVTPKPVIMITKSPSPKPTDTSLPKKIKDVVKNTERHVSSRNEKTWMFDDDDNAINLKRELKHPDDSKYNWRASSDAFAWPEEELKQNKKSSKSWTQRPVPSTNSPVKRQKPWVIQTTKLRSIKRHRNPFYKYRKGARTLRIRVQNDVKKTTKPETKTVRTTDPQNCITEKPKPKYMTLTKRPSVTQRAKLSRSPFRLRVKHRYPGYTHRIDRRQNDVSVRRNTPQQPVVHQVISQPQQRLRQLLHQPQQQLIHQPQRIQQQHLLQRPQLLQQPQHIMPHPQSTRPYVQQSHRPQSNLWYQYNPTFGYFWGRSVRPVLKCRAMITLGGGMDEWCTANCNANFCPGAMCVCEQEAPIFPNYSIYPQTVPWSKPYTQQVMNYNTNQRYPVAAALRAQAQPEVIQPPAMQRPPVQTQQQVVQPRVVQSQPEVVQTQRIVVQSPIVQRQQEVVQSRVIQKQPAQTQREVVQSRVIQKQPVHTQRKVVQRQQEVVHSRVIQKQPAQTQREVVQRKQEVVQSRVIHKQPAQTQREVVQSRVIHTLRNVQKHVVTPRVVHKPVIQQHQKKTQAPVHDHPNLQNRINRIQKQAKIIQQKAPRRSSSPYANRYSQKVVAGSVNHKTVSNARLASQKKIVSVAGKYICKATGRYTGLPQFDDWCYENCMKIICPLLICECRSH